MVNAPRAEGPFVDPSTKLKRLWLPKTRSALSPAHLQASGPSVVSEAKGKISPRKIETLSKRDSETRPVRWMTGRSSTPIRTLDAYGGGLGGPVSGFG